MFFEDMDITYIGPVDGHDLNGLIETIDRAKKLKNCFVMTFALLMLVETVQLFTLLGSFDIDDLLLNIIGAMLGYVIYVKISK